MNKPQFGLCGLLGTVAMCTAARGADLILLPVGASGPHTIVGREIVLESRGQDITLELRIADWYPHYLHVYQAQIDPSGYTSGPDGYLEPLTTPDTRAGAFIDVLHPEFIFSGLMIVIAVDRSQPGYRFGGLAVEHIESVADPGIDLYLGTLILRASSGAVGTFEVDFLPNGSFLINGQSRRIEPIRFLPAWITIDLPVVAGRCCIGFPEPSCLVTMERECFEQGGFFVAELDCAGTNPCPECASADHCDDRNECTNDRCVDGQCESTPHYGWTACDDGDPCTRGDICVDGICEGEPRGDCCHFDADCDDGLYCNGTESCLNGYCNVGRWPCLPGQCDENTQRCLGCQADRECDDGLYCNGTERCAGGQCRSGVPTCFAQVCDETRDACTGCLTHADCDDGMYCNGVEYCVAGQCYNGDSPCEADSCDEYDNVCAECAYDQECDDGLFCNGAEQCIERSCVSAVVYPFLDQFCSESRHACADCLDGLHCDDGVPCTVDQCILGVCIHTPDDARCAGDGLYCTGQPVCDAQLGCVDGLPPCDSDQICDEEARRCGQCAVDDHCDDGYFCNGAERCMTGTCEAGPPPCPQELCDESRAICEECLVASVCDDEDPCTLDDCVLGTCEHTPDAACDTLDAAVDGDQDGVPDSVDACPSTLLATLVDAYGCSCDQLDGDRDGISNCADSCPDTPSEERVGDDGCTLPADNVEDIDVPSAVPVNDETAGAPVAWPVAGDEGGDTGASDPQDGAAADEEVGLDTLSPRGPSICGSMAFIPIAFLIGSLMAARHRSLLWS